MRSFSVALLDIFNIVVPPNKFLWWRSIRLISSAIVVVFNLEAFERKHFLGNSYGGKNIVVVEKRLKSLTTR